MLIDKKIEKYVRSASRYVPARDKSRMRRELTDMIYEMLADYGGEDGPDILDCKDVLRDLGTPEEIAASYLESKRNRLEEQGQHGFSLRADWQELLLGALSVIGAVLVVVGVVGIGTQKFQTMLPLFLGVVCALVSIMGRSVLTSLLHIHPKYHDWE